MSNKYALQLEYDGSYFYGWQVQPSVATIQNSLEKALTSFANHQVNTIVAGRTDTGVHALNQVVHFVSDAKRTMHGWVDGLNSKLPSTIKVKNVTLVDSDFDARFSALSRTYHYYLLIQPDNSAILNRYLGWYYRELDVSAMQSAADLLIGKHDFSAFRASGCQANNPVRDMHKIEILREGNIIRFSLTANAFLHHMVRNIVGALVYVGNGRTTITEFSKILLTKDRRNSPPTFMPNGLYLTDVKYQKSIFPQPTEKWLFNI